MALYRCAACGSPNVVTDTQKEGYDYVKGAIGTAILGTGGAVAGIDGKTKRVFKCPDCGLTMNSPMPDEIKTLIDIGVMDVDARKRLTLRGLPMEWEFLISKYKNIESGVADEIAASREAHREQMRNTKYSIDWQIAFDYTSDEGKALLDSLKPAMDAEIAAAQEAEKAKYAEEAQRQQAKVNVLQKQKSELEAEKERISKTIASLGFFKFTEKKLANADLEAVNGKIAKLDEEISALLKASNGSTLSDSDKTIADMKIKAAVLMKYVGFAMTSNQVNDALIHLGYIENISSYLRAVHPRLRVVLADDEWFNKEWYSDDVVYYTLAN